MNHELICPECQAAFHDEEYCPRHGLRLVRPTAPEPGTPPQWVTGSGSAPEAQAGSDHGGTRTSGTSEESESKLAQAMKRFGLRRATGRTGPADEDKNPAAGTAEPPSLLPEAATAKGWRIAGPVREGNAMDIWPVEGGPAVAGMFHRFRSGALTSHALYLRLEEHAPPGLARVWAHGTVDLAGARADYELVSLFKAGAGLDQWLADGKPSETRAWHLLPKLAELLQRLAEAGVQPLCFDPGQLQLTDDGELWLATAAALTETAASGEYRPELQRNTLLPHGWAAPELTQEGMASAGAAVFSLGQLLALAAWGQSCSLAELNTGAVPFRSLADARLARVLMGCLWPRPSGRWSLGDVSRALDSANAETMPAIPPWDSLAPGASSTAFGFAGASFWRLEYLLAAAVQPPNWNEAIARIDAILDWAEGTAWAGQSKLMREAQVRGRSPDWVLVALNRAVRPDAPLTWRALDLSDEGAARSLAALAQRALKDGEADVETMRQLFQTDLRGAFGQTSSKS